MKKSSPSFRRVIQCSSFVLSLLAASQLHAGTVAYWRFEGNGGTAPTANAQVTGFAQHSAVQNNGVLAVDSSGNGNTIYGWDSNPSGYNGFWIEYETNTPAAKVPLTGATNNWGIWTVPFGNNFPAIATWSATSSPTGTNIETITPKAWTIEASINGSAYPGGNHTFVGRDGNHVTGNANLAPLYFQVNNGTAANLVISFADKAGTFYTIQDPASLAVGQWYNVAAVSDGTNLFLYKDVIDGNGYQLVGKTALTSTNTALAIPTGTYATMADGTTWAWALARGRYGTGANAGDNHVDRFYGYIDEVRISDAALRPTQLLFATTNVYFLQSPSPTNLVVPLGASASFSVVVGGVGATVQWQHAGTNIAGATNLTYAIATTVAGQDGLYTVVAKNAFSTNTSGVATLQFHAPLNLTWAGNNSVWDTVTSDWTTNNGTGTLAYVETDNVRFTPLGIANSTVTISSTVNPTSILVSNASYTLTGGTIVGGSLTVRTNASLILDTVDSSSGPTTINGTLQVGNGDTGITLGSGAITNNGSLLFNLGGDATVSQAIAGNGNITNLGSAGAVFLNGNVTANAINMAGSGALVLQGSNSFGSGLLISSSVVYPQNSYALGSAPVTVNSGAQLYMNYNLNFPGSTLILAGGLLHKGGAGLSVFGGPVTMTADSTIHNDGGASLNFTNPAGITSAGNNLTLTGDGGSVGSFSGSVALGAGTVTKSGGGTWRFFGNGNTWSALTISGGTLQIGDGGADGSLGGGNIQDDATLNFNSSANLNVTNEIDGAGAIMKNGSGTVTLANANNTYAGVTTVNSGTLLVNGTASGSGLNVNAGTLGGTGVVSGATFIFPSGTLAPGAGNLGTLNFNSDLTIGGNLAFKVKKSVSPSNDVASVGGSLSNTNNGTLSIQNLGGALKVGDTFTLFTGPLTGGNLLTISTAGGIVWSNNLAVDGSVSVLSTNVPRPIVKGFSISGTNIVVSGTNGLANGNYFVLATTNLTLPRASWTSIATNAFDANGNFNFTNAVNAGNPQSFYLLQLP